MSKRELIDAILQHNRTAAPEFLAKFAESELKAYLDRMALIHGGMCPSNTPLAMDTRRALVVS